MWFFNENALVLWIVEFLLKITGQILFSHFIWFEFGLLLLILLFDNSLVFWLFILFKLWYEWAIFSFVGGFACSLCWLMYGFYQKDLNLIIPNALGLAAAILQVVVYLIYYCKSKETAPDFPGENDEVV